ncbi:hypothetical protein K1719_033391 [Acacia pycnantha]|nr:hypothetical protein K1719_033391 [Acacia pycnantha]
MKPLRRGLNLYCSMARCGAGISLFTRLGWSLVLESSSLQRVRRETRAGADHFQHCLRLLLQSPLARPLRDHSHPFQRG